MDKRYRLARLQLSHAIAADEQGDFTHAVSFYANACAYFISGIACDRSSQSRAKIIKSVSEYLSRAEYINQASKQQSRSSSKKGTVLGSRELDELLPSVDANSTIENLAIEKVNRENGFASVAGLAKVKRALSEAVILPVKHPNLFNGSRKPWRSILLYGPPGTGKTHIAAALSKEAKCEFISVSASDIISKSFGQSERTLCSIFERARSKKRCVLFFDEIDSIGRSRDNTMGGSESSRRLLTELLRQMDGFESKPDGITVLAATNHPFDLDSALRRRFSKRIYVPMPGSKVRSQILRLALGEDESVVAVYQSDIERIANKTTGYSGADLSVVANDALMMPLRKCLDAKHFIPVLPNRTQNIVGYGESFAIKLGIMTENSVLVPCSPLNPLGHCLNIMDPDFPTDKLYLPPVTIADLEQALLRHKPSVGRNLLTKYAEFAASYGEKNDVKDFQDDESEDIGPKCVKKSIPTTGPQLVTKQSSKMKNTYSAKKVVFG